MSENAAVIANTWPISSGYRVDSSDGGIVVRLDCGITVSVSIDCFSGESAEKEGAHMYDSKSRELRCEMRWLFLFWAGRVYSLAW